MKLSVVIPAYNEEGCIEGTVRGLNERLRAEGITHEIVVANDNSQDSTQAILDRLAKEIPGALSPCSMPARTASGWPCKGLESFTGAAVAVYMADASDRPEDLVRFYRVMQEKNVECVFGSRFHRLSRVVDYPWPKLFLNRMANNVIRFAFGIRYNDVTNAFKLYRANVILGRETVFKPAFQSYRGDPIEGDRARLFLCRGAKRLDQPQIRGLQVQNQGNRKPLSLHRA